MDDEKIKIPAENFIPVIANMLMDIVAWQEVQLELAARQMAKESGRPFEDAREALVQQKDKYRVEVVKTIWEHYGPNFGSDLQKS